MKRYFALVLVALMAHLTGVRAQGLDDQYVQIFNLIQEADSLAVSDPAQSLRKYLDAQAALQRFQKGNPDWNPRVVSFRLSYIAEKLGGLSTSVPPSQVDTNKSAAPPASAALGTELQVQMAALQQQIRQLQADRQLLEAKLKEALSAQPAQSDPAELARAEEKIKTLQKENDLLKVKVEDDTPKGVAAEVKNLEQTQQALSRSQKQETEYKEMITRLTAEKEALQARLKSNPDVAALQAENELLKKQVADAASAKAAGAPQSADPTRLKDSQAQIAALQSDKELLRLEKIALENRIKQLAGGATPATATQPAAAEADANRILQLERERDNLQKQLEAANKAAFGKKGKSGAARVQELELQLASARARLDVLEARQVPYTPEELALMKQPEGTLTQPPPKAPRKKELPRGSAKLASEAQTFFAARQYDRAEATYQEIVKMDPKNVPALANLATIQLQAGNLQGADTTIKTALAEDPEDAAALLALGILKFRERKNDEALDVLSRAAKLEPENPEIHNYLGLTLSEKGMRAAAENSLRKAVQLQPNYSTAHYALAIVYLAQQPPATELARWHYQKARSLGEAANPELEKRLGPGSQ